MLRIMILFIFWENSWLDNFVSRLMYIWHLWKPLGWFLDLIGRNNSVIDGAGHFRSQSPLMATAKPHT